MSQSELCQSFLAVQARLRQALDEARRAPDAALLLAVSKTKPASMLREAYALGQHHFGENYLQEALDKQSALADLDDLVWHFIGPLQSNKTRPVAEHFHWVHSIEREKIARRLSDQRPDYLPPLQVCLQVNISNEPSKSGVTLDELESLAASVVELPGLALRGLMAIPAPSENTLEQRKPYARLRAALEALRGRFPQAPLDTLSMGMSADLEAAVAEGATLVRVGTALFGRRDAP
ncbi:YggS family pyridoxal phosphate-dependent enzyme [Pistricoccus aurantiacus]|uniref:Pyridoxal phosphate homeostasis protein n=1 Tax=Pistricoccus aurantiacus TaxID=1883414 RepID=A0A5B8SPA0_9GAMM|nr:YggS family pyridoxal phosphate-dependent enzyme [Pistricoccus aurantiacus]QEA38586.1 YggS family pyridoxal phosphate-dependent enzyme [Pistricoccus aurantiacus]